MTAKEFTADDARNYTLIDSIIERAIAEIKQVAVEGDDRCNLKERMADMEIDWRTWDEVMSHLKSRGFWAYTSNFIRWDA